jgi:hypothetical protein
MGAGSEMSFSTSFKAACADTSQTFGSVTLSMAGLRFDKSQSTRQRATKELFDQSNGAQPLAHGYHRYGRIEHGEHIRHCGRLFFI